MLQGFFRLIQLKKLSLSDNEICRLSGDVGSFTNLMEMDVSRNGKLLNSNHILLNLTPNGSGLNVGSIPSAAILEDDNCASFDKNTQIVCIRR